MGWYLTAAALGRALNVSMITHWSVGNPRAGNGANEYDVDTLLRLIQLPKSLHLAEWHMGDWQVDVSEGNLRQTFHHNSHRSWISRRNITATMLAWSETYQLETAKEAMARQLGRGAPQMPDRYDLAKELARQGQAIDPVLQAVSMEYVPEWTWQHLGHELGPLRRAVAPSSPSAVPPRCVTRRSYLAAYRHVQAEVRPRIDLCLPRPRTYIALHLRRGDRLNNLLIEKEDREAMRTTGLTTRSLETLLSIAVAVALPVLVLSNDLHVVEGVTAALQQKDLDVLRISTTCESLRIEEWAAASSLRHQQRALQLTNMTANTLRDWFAISSAAGVLVDVGTPWGQGDGLWAESSFSTTAALTGGAPLLSLLSRAQPCHKGVRRFSGVCADFETLPPVNGTFVAAESASFVEAIRSENRRGRLRAHHAFS